MLVRCANNAYQFTWVRLKAKGVKPTRNIASTARISISKPCATNISAPFEYASLNAKLFLELNSCCHTTESIESYFMKS